MSHRVYIREGRIFKSTWNGESGKYEEKEFKSFIPLLNFPVQIENTTFGQFFMLLEPEWKVYEKVYESALYGHPLKDFIDECKVVEGKPGDIEYVEVYWGAEIDEHEEYPEEDNGQRPFGDYLCVFPGFHGWGLWKDPLNPELKGGFGLDFSPLYNYQMLPLKLNKEFNIYQWGKNPKSAPKEPVLTCYKDFTVHDVLSAILYEISFMGGPVSRDEMMQEFKNTVREARENLDQEAEGDA